MQLHNLEYKKGSRNHKAKRVGRGHGSGLGKTSGRGQDGQKARKSGQVRLAFEGGQTPLYRRTPKVGFNNDNFANKYNVVTLAQIAQLSEKEITLEVLAANRLLKNKQWDVKIIGNTQVSAKVVYAHKFSKGALDALAASKTKVETITK
ncbi:50S ribosomal protein L15 [Ureaplasma diversum]|uniref:Large ribosomal subunit protein uL15 n=2 Tax=Ureaplasma diversum TaxID=42094 RepID=A0A084F1P9_9BACT|nr:50S ribosomal protein L15 [Ureaplasma diversum]AJQ45615.1 50S ribosomal protein L15 [Ureaplasma diversum]KEZ24141.1 50S ribosomal protein L15 [Ureaplasma diversum NCTC 246]